MKINVEIYFKEIDDILSSSIEWNYPILPRIGETIRHPILFMSDSLKEMLQKITLKNIKDEGFRKYFENIKIRNLLDYYSDYPDDPFIVNKVEWIIGIDGMPLPEINIRLK